MDVIHHVVQKLEQSDLFTLHRSDVNKLVQSIDEQIKDSSTSELSLLLSSSAQGRRARSACRNGLMAVLDDAAFEEGEGAVLLKFAESAAQAHSRLVRLYGIMVCSSIVESKEVLTKLRAASRDSSTDVLSTLLHKIATNRTGDVSDVVCSEVIRLLESIITSGDSVDIQSEGLATITLMAARNAIESVQLEALQGLQRALEFDGENGRIDVSRSILAQSGSSLLQIVVTTEVEAVLQQACKVYASAWRYSIAKGFGTDFLVDQQDPRLNSGISALLWDALLRRETKEVVAREVVGRLVFSSGFVTKDRSESVQSERECPASLIADTLVEFISMGPQLDADRVHTVDCVECLLAATQHSGMLVELLDYATDKLLSWVTENSGDADESSTLKSPGWSLVSLVAALCRLADDLHVSASSGSISVDSVVARLAHVAERLCTEVSWKSGLTGTLACIWTLLEGPSRNSDQSNHSAHSTHRWTASKPVVRRLMKAIVTQQGAIPCASVRLLVRIVGKVDPAAQLELLSTERSQLCGANLVLVHALETLCEAPSIDATRVGALTTLLDFAATSASLAPLCLDIALVQLARQSLVSSEDANSVSAVIDRFGTVCTSLVSAQSAEQEQLIFKAQITQRLCVAVLMFPGLFEALVSCVSAVKSFANLAVKPTKTRKVTIRRETLYDMIIHGLCYPGMPLAELSMIATTCPKAVIETHSNELLKLSLLQLESSLILVNKGPNDFQCDLDSSDKRNTLTPIPATSLVRG